MATAFAYSLAFLLFWLCGTEISDFVETHMWRYAVAAVTAFGFGVFLALLGIGVL